MAIDRDAKLRSKRFRVSTYDLRSLGYKMPAMVTVE